MSGRRVTLGEAIVNALAAYGLLALWEAYCAFRPLNLTDRISDWLASSQGRFEAFLAEQERRRREAGKEGDQ